MGHIVCDRVTVSVTSVSPAAESMIMFRTNFDKNLMPTPEQALPGRQTPLATAQYHFVNGHRLKDTWSEPLRTIVFGMGCFWGAERVFWNLPGVYVTAAGYSGGYTPNPTYEEVCSGLTGHAEVVLVVYDHEKIELAELLKVFWEGHDPTQYMRQGNDRGTNYRSAVYVRDEDEHKAVLESRKLYEEALKKRGLGPIVTEMAVNRPFYYAEEYHQQYLAKNPGGYCGLQGTGVSCPVGLGIKAS